MIVRLPVQKRHRSSFVTVMTAPSMIGPTIASAKTRRPDHQRSEGIPSPATQLFDPLARFRGSCRGECRSLERRTRRDRSPR